MGSSAGSSELIGESGRDESGHQMGFNDGYVLNLPGPDATYPNAGISVTGLCDDPIPFALAAPGFPRA